MSPPSPGCAMECPLCCSIRAVPNAPSSGENELSLIFIIRGEATISIFDRLLGAKKAPPTPTAQPTEKIAVPAELQQSPTVQAAGKAPTPLGSATPPPASPDQIQKTKKEPTNAATWLLDIPDPFQGRSESKDAIQLEMTQKTVNEIGSMYKTLHNWKSTVGPDQVFLSCDVPLDVERSAIQATFKGKNPGIAFGGPRSSPTPIRFGLLVWDKCCQWKLKALGVKESDAAAQTRNKRMEDGLAYELEVHVQELITIGAPNGTYSSGSFLGTAQPRISEIGQYVDCLSSRLMSAAHSAVRRQLGEYAAREL